MSDVLNLSPAQLVLGFILHAWIFIVFPVLVLRKINYLTGLVEGLYGEEDNEPPADRGP